jgi:pyroglutamyl-peptidase
MSLLITGFGPFDGGPNCSQALLAALWRRREDMEQRWGDTVAFVDLAVDTEAAEDALNAALAVHQPTHVLLMGQAAGREALSLESTARNARDLAVPDACGRMGPLGPVRAGGADVRSATWPDLDGAAQAVSASGIPCRVSDDAGSHLCNQTLYLALEAGERARPPFVATFLHLPLTREQVAAGVPAAVRRPGCFALPLDEMVRAVGVLLRHTRMSAAALPPV